MPINRRMDRKGKLWYSHTMGYYTTGKITGVNLNGSKNNEKSKL